MAQHDCVVALRALGEDTRVRIISLLLDGNRDVTEIGRELGVSQYNVSKHLRILREAGLLEVQKDGRQRFYTLPEHIRRRAAAAGVLDLGCCSFQFEEPAAAESGAPRDRRGGRPAGQPRQARIARPRTVG
jgi:DNA-binding transcriptional ArsR family regulator